MLTESSLKVAPRYACEPCDYSTSKGSNWSKHIATHKHQMLTDANESSRPETSADEHTCRVCGRSYRHKASLCRHRKTCQPGADASPSPGANTHDCAEAATGEELAELRAKAALYDQQCESVNELKALVEKVAEQRVVTTTTNNVNIHVVLEQKCSGALNISEFVNSLRLTLEDLSYTQRNGFVKGVSNVFIKNLQGLQPAIRPIHCADKQGKRLYIRDANKWGEDPDGSLMGIQIGVVTKKQIEALKAWEAANANWRNSEDGTRAYMALVQEITGGSSEAERERSQRLIQREIGRSCGIRDLVTPG
jgi:hypothetical protein